MLCDMHVPHKIFTNLAFWEDWIWWWKVYTLILCIITTKDSAAVVITLGIIFVSATQVFEVYLAIAFYSLMAQSMLFKQ